MNADPGFTFRAASPQHHPAQYWDIESPRDRFPAGRTKRPARAQQRYASRQPVATGAKKGTDHETEGATKDQGKRSQHHAGLKNRKLAPPKINSNYPRRSAPGRQFSRWRSPG